MLKIDGSFVRDILRDERAESMVRAIAQLARAMNITTVAEYVETEEIRTRVRSLGVGLRAGICHRAPGAGGRGAGCAAGPCRGDTGGPSWWTAVPARPVDPATP
jgi:predicted signal transduction protein with EAL and GGDEF domain